MTEDAITVLALWRACRAALEEAGIENAAAETDWLWQAAVGNDRHLLRPDEPLGIHTLEVFGVRSGDCQISSAFQRIVIKEMSAPQRYRVEHFFIGMEILHAGHGIIMPVHDHLFAADGIGLFCTHPCKKCTLHRRGDYHSLPFLHIQTHTHQQAGILL